VAFAIRRTSGRRLGAEAARVRDAGSEVILIQPTVHDLDVMGTNLMSRSRRHAVIDIAVQTVSDHLRESPIGDRLGRLLPPGSRELVERPPGPAGSWPDLQASARRRWTSTPADSDASAAARGRRAA
jgi:hypothetical protein